MKRRLAALAVSAALVAVPVLGFHNAHHIPNLVCGKVHGKTVALVMHIANDGTITSDRYEAKDCK